MRRWCGPAEFCGPTYFVVRVAYRQAFRARDRHRLAETSQEGSGRRKRLNALEVSRGNQQPHADRERGGDSELAEAAHRVQSRMKRADFSPAAAPSFFEKRPNACSAMVATVLPAMRTAVRNNAPSRVSTSPP